MERLADKALASIKPIPLVAMDEDGAFFDMAVHEIEKAREAFGLEERLRRVDHIEVEMPPPLQRQIMRMRFLKAPRFIADARTVARLLAGMNECAFRAARRARAKIAVGQIVHDIGDGHRDVPDVWGINRIQGLSRGGQ